MKININELRSAVANSKSRKEIPIKLGLQPSSYLEAVLSKFITDYNISVSHFDRGYSRVDYSKPEKILNG